MRIKFPFEISNLKPDDKDFVNYTAQILNALVATVNGDISLVDNGRTSLVRVLFNIANTQQAIQHTLNKVPVGYIQVGAVAAAQLFNGTSANTSSILYVQSTVATTVTLLIF